MAVALQCSACTGTCPTPQLHLAKVHLPHPSPTPPPGPARPAAYEEGVKKMGEGIARIGIISLVSAADTAKPLAPPGLGLRREPSGAIMGGGGGTGGGGGAAEQPRTKSGLSAAALELAAAPFAQPLTSTAAGNQKLLLLAAFLQVRAEAWRAAALPPVCGVCYVRPCQPLPALLHCLTRRLLHPCCIASPVGCSTPAALPASPSPDRRLGARAGAHALVARPGHLRLCHLPACGPGAV